MFPMKITKKIAISLAAISGGAYYCLQDPAVVALIPQPWGLIVSKFVVGITVGGVGYSMQPKKDAAEDGPKE